MNYSLDNIDIIKVNLIPSCSTELQQALQNNAQITYIAVMFPNNEFKNIFNV